MQERTNGQPDPNAPASSIFSDLTCPPLVCRSLTRMFRGANSGWALGHQPALQGARAIAVLAVFGFHVGRLRGGWLGVEAFFVLSGFLITILILTANERRAFNISDFLRRRAARLLPACVLVVNQY